MGKARARDRRAGIWREGPLERARMEDAQARARERQRKPRRRRREAAQSSRSVTTEEGSTSDAEFGAGDGVN